MPFGHSPYPLDPVPSMSPDSAPERPTRMASRANNPHRFERIPLAQRAPTECNYVVHDTS
jgi:hypothetical protein